MNGGKFGGITYIADNFTNQKIPRPYQSLRYHRLSFSKNILFYTIEIDFFKYLPFKKILDFQNSSCHDINQLTKNSSLPWWNIQISPNLIITIGQNTMFSTWGKTNLCNKETSVHVYRNLDHESYFQSLYGFDLQMYMYLGDQLRKLIIISTYKIRLRMKIRLKKLQLRCLVFQ